MLRLTLRNLFARKIRLLMSGLAIVLGVAFLAGVLVFSNGLSATFDNITQGSTPDGVVRVAESVESDAGWSGVSDLTLSPADVTDLEALPEVARADGDVVGFGLTVLAADGTVIGGTGAPTLAFNWHDGPNMAGESILVLEEGSWPEGSDEIVLDAASAGNGDYEVGDTVGLLAPYGEVNRTAELTGIAEFRGGTAGATLVLFSTSGAQEVFLGGKDAYSRISLTAVDGVTQAELADAASTVVGDGFEAVTGDTVVEEQQDAFGEFLGVINIFLLVFAIIAVVVGGFIIVNTFSILVAQRTRELALLRALGAARGQVTRSVLVEAVVLGLLASTLGVLLGWGLAHGLAALFRAVGLDIAGSALDLTPTAIGISYLVGVVVTTLAAWFPARRAGRVPPVAAMSADAVQHRGSLRRRTVIGLGVLALGAGLAGVGLAGVGNAALLIGVAAGLWVLTFAALSSVLGRPVLVVLRAIYVRLFGTTGRLAGENALRDPRRTGATAAALMIGLALVSTIGVLAASLNASVDDVVDEEFTADFLVQNSSYLPFSTAVGDAFADVDGVDLVNRQQSVSGSLDSEPVTVAGTDENFGEIYELAVVEGTQEFGDGEAVVFEEFARTHGLAVGDTFSPAFPGDRSLDLEVVGIVESTEVTWPVTVTLDSLSEAGFTRQDFTISITVADGADVEAVRADLEEAAAAVPTVAVYDKEGFADAIGDQVNQLLFMIYGLLALAIVIAIIGIINTLGLSVLERTREIGLLRAVGLSRARLRRVVTLESVAIAVLGAVLGMALGLVVGSLLRWALRDDLTSLGLPLGQLAIFLVLAVVVGVIAAVIPAIRAARMNVLAAIATE